MGVGRMMIPQPPVSLVQKLSKPLEVPDAGQAGVRWSGKTEQCVLISVSCRCVSRKLAMSRVAVSDSMSPLRISETITSTTVSSTIVKPRGWERRRALVNEDGFDNYSGFNHFAA